MYIGVCVVKPVLNSHSKEDQKLDFKTDYHLMHVKSIAECSKENSAILLTCIKLPPIFKTYVLSILEWSPKTGFAVCIWASTLEFGTYCMGEQMHSLARALASHIHKEWKWRKAQTKNLNL